MLMEGPGCNAAKQTRRTYNRASDQLAIGDPRDDKHNVVTGGCGIKFFGFF